MKMKYTFLLESKQKSENLTTHKRLYNFDDEFHILKTTVIRNEGGLYEKEVYTSYRVVDVSVLDLELL